MAGHYKPEARCHLHKIQKAVGVVQCLSVIEDVPARFSSDLQVCQQLVRLKAPEWSVPVLRPVCFENSEHDLQVS